MHIKNIFYVSLFKQSCQTVRHVDIGIDIPSTWLRVWETSSLRLGWAALVKWKFNGIVSTNVCTMCY